MAAKKSTRGSAVGSKKKLPGKLSRFLNNRKAAMLVAFIVVFAGVGGFYYYQSSSASINKNPFNSCRADGIQVSRGSRGACVRAVQGALRDIYQKGATNATDPNCESLSTDGIFGPHTERCVRYFQERTYSQVDGIVGPQTWGALRSTCDRYGLRTYNCGYSNGLF